MIDIILGGLAAVCLVASLVPLLPFGHGLVRSFDFGRLQVIGVSASVIIVAVLFGSLTPPLIAAVIMAGVASAIQLVYVVRFTPLWPVQTASFAGDSDAVPMISVLACNVKQGNRDYQRVIDLVRDTEPDIAVFMETDQAWADALRPCLSGYRERIEQPQQDSYGMILASRFPLAAHEVQFLLNEEVPSIFCLVELPGGRRVRLIALHPEPPLPNRDTLGRDAEILIVAKKARGENLPVIVTGDLNDVAWSRTTRRFLRISGLLDPRQGRGMFNSFDARYWFLRWPLDHIFHSHHFELVSLARQRFVGSDHFPMFYRLALTGTDHNDPPPEPSSDDIAEADEAIKVEASRDRPPAGTDWE
ncbi:endonuclease/exonuclease/phosphatase family protein [Hoeflea sp. YIM 152468]|uniref:endonuclease/exonuclease/phosphatase family protein n=1 Tax=Hoeflea sp. YIM 152468 TaxID=3031759 RepID=UPI0023DBC662|nr:endonuclease/exonuclease/phosphatase family protein [Hoeflea sp. YIM 152468]MDF1606697.1 endonuclease/exonuclease/phosphatase family protein [Hoeflea sp. YIM 152468]